MPSKPRYRKTALQFEDIRKKLGYMKKEVSLIPQQAELIIEKAREVAYNALSNAEKGATSYNTEFTQKYGAYDSGELKKHICVVSNTVTNRYSLVLDAVEGSDLYWNLIFAEYGAGLSAEYSDEYLGYSHKKRVSTMYSNEKFFGKWYFYDLKGEPHEVNNSIPIRYMRLAQRSAKKNVKDLLKKKAQHKKTSDWKPTY